jgi:DNA replication protein DnaC
MSKKPPKDRNYCDVCQEETVHYKGECMPCRDRYVAEEEARLANQAAYARVQGLYHSKDVIIDRELVNLTRQRIQDGGAYEQLRQHLTSLKSTGKWAGGNIFLYGQYGNGKTTIALTIVERLLHAGYSSWAFICCSRNKTTEAYTDILKPVKSVSVLILDDIEDYVRQWRSGDTVYYNDVDQLRLKGLIDYRRKNGLITIITGNKNEPSLMSTMLGGACYDRLLQDLTQIYIKEKSFRH